MVVWVVAVYEYLEEEGERRLQINAQNCKPPEGGCAAPAPCRASSRLVP